MPQVIVLALLAAGAYAGYRLLLRTSREIAAKMQQSHEELQRASPPPERDLGKLEYDAESGVYRPAKQG